MTRRAPAITAITAITAVTVIVAAVAGVLGVAGAETGRSASSARRSDPIVIGHRGASGYRPEHTLAAYELAIDMGADYIEPDLVSTRDGVLVARHENEISGTTDVAAHPEFADRHDTRIIDGREVAGWFTEDFTLAELRTLRAVERLPEIRPDNTVFNGLYQVPTLQEVIDLAQERGVGIYPETKHPTYFDSIGLSMEEPLVALLDGEGYTKRNDPVFIQSFETANLRDLNTMTDVRLVQLVDCAGAPYDLVAAGDPRTYADLVKPAGLAEIAEYADGLGACKNLIVPRNAAGALLQPTTLVARRSSRPAGRPCLDVPQREHVPAHRLPRRRPGPPALSRRHRRRSGRVPAVLPAGNRRHVQRQSRHRGRRAGGVHRAPLASGGCRGEVAPGRPALGSSGRSSTSSRQRRRAASRWYWPPPWPWCGPTRHGRRPTRRCGPPTWR